MSETEKKNTKITVIVAVIGFFGTILAAVLPVIIENLQNKPVVPTMTMTDAITTETTPGTASSKTPSATELVLTPTQTKTPAGGETPVTPPLDCLDRWQAFSSDAKVLPEPIGSGSCSFVSDENLGIGTGRDSLVFAVANFKNKGVFGISTSMPRNATIRLTVGASSIKEGEFWVAFSRGADPQENALELAIQPETGDVQLYLGRNSISSAHYLWSTIQTGQPAQKPGAKTYAFEFVFEGMRVGIFINGISFGSQASPAWENLFLGYRAESQNLGTTIDVDVTGLSVDGQ